VEEQTHAYVPVGFLFELINKTMGREIDPNLYPNREKLTGFWVAGIHCHLIERSKKNCNDLVSSIGWTENSLPKQDYKVQGIVHLDVVSCTSSISHVTSSA
jgi:hypothetical protein